jgi:hypothetical protein
MTLSAGSQKMIDAYLRTLRRQLRDLMDEDVRDIVEELRAHILDKTSTEASPESVAATLDALGTPQQLAFRYRTDELLERARLSRSAATILRRFLRWAGVSLAGLVVFLISTVGYGIGGFLVWLGATKAIAPHKTSVDLEFNSHTWAASFQSGGPPHGHDPFGLWLIPLCLVLGGGILFLTFRFGSWGLRKFWRRYDPPNRLVEE